MKRVAEGGNFRAADYNDLIDEIENLQRVVANLACLMARDLAEIDVSALVNTLKLDATQREE